MTRKLFMSIFGCLGTGLAQISVDVLSRGTLLVKDSDVGLINSSQRGVAAEYYDTNKDGELKLTLRIHDRDKDGSVRIDNEFGTLVTIWKDGYCTGDSGKALEILVSKLIGPASK